MIEFSEKQSKTIATGVTVLAVALVAGFVSLIAWGAIKALSFISSALIPVALGFFLSLFFRPYFLWWKRHTKRNWLALLLMMLTILVPAGLLAWYAGAIAVDQISNLVAQGPDLFAKATEWFNTTFPRLQALLDRLGVPYRDLGGLYTSYGSSAMQAGAGAVKFLKGIVSAIITLLFFIFFLTSRARSGSEILNEMAFLKDETRKFVANQIDAFVQILVSFFQRQAIICLLEGLLYGLGFAFVGLEYGFIIGFTLGVINLIPLCGSLVCLPIALPLAYFGPGGSGLRVTLVLAVWATIQVLDGYLITPKIQGDRTGLNYIGVIFSFIFWTAVLGPVLGMLLAIPLSAFWVVFWRAIKQKYMRPVV
ncbi:MAG: AI-2E family transporter [Lentisphaerae bacterium]|nr:AI-2E family transporter [Lentisphaerota bacterium]